jgi:hypothetical protein
VGELGYRIRDRIKESIALERVEKRELSREEGTTRKTPARIRRERTKGEVGRRR